MLAKKNFFAILKKYLEKGKKLIFLSSSMAEHSAVNRRVVGSSPTWGVFYWARFDFYYYNDMESEYFKYTSFETARIILSDLTIRFSKPCSFNDIYDCETPYKIINKFFKKDLLALYNSAFLLCHDDVMKNKLEIGYNKVRNGEYSDEEIQQAAKIIIDNCRNYINKNQRVLCLSKNNDKILMWSHYAQNHAGVVIGFDKNYKFIKNAREVKYSENLQKIEGRILKDLHSSNNQTRNEYIALFLTKYIDWQYENEVRCFFDVNKLANYFDEIKIQNIDLGYIKCLEQLKDEADFIDLPIAKECIKSIYLGVEMNILAKDEIIALVKNINNSIKIYKTKKANNSYKLYFEELF